RAQAPRARAPRIAPRAPVPAHRPSGARGLAPHPLPPRTRPSTPAAVRSRAPAPRSSARAGARELCAGARVLGLAPCASSEDASAHHAFADGFGGAVGPCPRLLLLSTFSLGWIGADPGGRRSHMC